MQGSDPPGLTRFPCWPCDWPTQPNPPRDRHVAELVVQPPNRRVVHCVDRLQSLESFALGPGDLRLFQRSCDPAASPGALYTRQFVQCEREISTNPRCSA